MPPLLSVVIPYYNHHEALPIALESVLSQTLKDVEAVVVDDCSDHPCDDIVAGYRAKGLNVTLARNETRKYTKESRLIGIEAAQGKLITFLDADDHFYKNAALEYHVARQLETGADIVHFDILYYRDGIKKPESPWWAKPLAEELRDGDIFRAYLAGDCGGHTVWGKIATRELWLACLPHARASSVRRYMEDLLLGSLLFFHARRYIGSSRIGYVYFHHNAEALHKGFGRCASLYAMLTEFLPYLRQRGADAAACADMQAYLFKKMKENMLKYLEYVYPKLPENNLPPESVFSEMREHAEPDMALRTLTTGLMQILRAGRNPHGE
jgi:glycosyltransferase involved in cell wall biosynthesis